MQILRYLHSKKLAVVMSHDVLKSSGLHCPHLHCRSFTVATGEAAAMEKCQGHQATQQQTTSSTGHGGKDARGARLGALT